MKKIIIALALVISFTGIISAHEIRSDDNTKLLFTIQDSTWNSRLAEDMAMNPAYGQSKLPIILKGTGDCPKWYPMNCVDLTGTQAYKDQMFYIARELKAKGFASQFPMFAKWFR